MKNTTFIGSVGEQIAVDYLKDKGYRIIERNVKICGVEIDIICEAYLGDDGEIVRTKTDFLTEFIRKHDLKKKHPKKFPGRVIVFCEVKTRSDDEYGSGAEAVSPYKMGRYVTAAKAYMANSKNVDDDVRFDIIEVGKNKINHIVGAFIENDARYPKR